MADTTKKTEWELRKLKVEGVDKVVDKIIKEIGNDPTNPTGNLQPNSLKNWFLY